MTALVIILIIVIIIGYITLRDLIKTQLSQIELVMTWMKKDLTEIKDKLNSLEAVKQKVEQEKSSAAETEESHDRWMPHAATVTESPREDNTTITEEPKQNIIEESIPFKADDSTINYSEAVNTSSFDETAPVEPITSEAFLQGSTLDNKKEIITDKADSEIIEKESVKANPFAIPPTSSHKEQKVKVKETNPDFEKFVGENLINKIGIAILVLGIGFFVKYAIDKNWINEIGRVFIGILCGGILIGVAHKLRQSFVAFSSVLIGGGLSVLYFSVGLAFMEYHLLSQPAAFVMMVVITAFAVTLSFLYNRIELAVLALIGGFGTPFFVSTGEGNYLILFTYLIILNTGMLVVASYKKWNLVNILSYLFTIIIYGGWLIRELGLETPHLAGAFAFGTIFYLMFALMNVTYNIKYKQKFEAIEFALLLSNTFLYYSAGMSIMHHLNDGMYEGLFTVAMGVINFAFAWVMHRLRAFDKNLFYLLIGLVLTFISLAAPIQLKGNYITLFWAAESVLLLWLSQKSGISIIKIASMVVAGLMLISLGMDWIQIYEADTLQNIVFNKGFITGISSAVALTVYNLLLRKESDATFIEGVSISSFKYVVRVIVTALIYLTIFIELTYQMSERIDLVSSRREIVWGYNFLFASVLAFLFRNNKQQSTIVSIISSVGVGAIIYMTLYNPAVIAVRNNMIEGASISIWIFGIHFLFSLSFLYLLYHLKERIEQSIETIENKVNAYWYIIPVFVFWLSAELDHVVIMLGAKTIDNVPDIITQVHKFGYPILWGITSFIMVVIGLKSKNKTLRVIGLSLFSLIVLKLFLFDVWGMSEGGKILAFVLLGILLLVVSFMYQKLKKMVSDEE